MREQRPLSPLLLILTTLLSAVGASAAATSAPPPVTAVPPAVYSPAPVAKAAPTLLLGATAPALSITLPEPTTADRAVAKFAVATPAGDKGQPLQVGFGRDVPSAQKMLVLSSLQWRPTADGGRAARITVESTGAAGIRLQLILTAAHPDLMLRLVGNGAKAEVQGPYPASAIVGAMARFGGWWSPVLEGSRATVEIAAGPGVAIDGAKLTLGRVAHLTLAGDSLRPGALIAKGIGDSDSCNIDVNCVDPQDSSFLNMTKATAKVVFMQEDGNTYSCTGTLLNDSITSFTPLFFTANHCINSAFAAETMNVYWFYKSSACGLPNTAGPYQLQTAGATLLGRSLAEDWALVRLNAAPPAGTYFSAWRAEGVTTGQITSTFHNPSGDLQKWSQGNMQGYVSTQIEGDDGLAGTNDFLAGIKWTQGTTEQGSSGSALLTFLQSGGYYEVRGGLSGGAASCQNRNGIDYFSRLEKMLPLTREYLTPDAADPTGLVVVVEFYNASLDHFFITSSATEVDLLDRGVLRGWERTGFRFLAYSTPVAGTNPVCRFYRTPGFGDSHFYSASPAECASVINNPVKFPGWTYESPNVFYIALPTPSGACAAGTHPLWRFFNTNTTNHRYTQDISVRDNLRVTPGLIPEGYGPDAVIMCSPDGS